MNKTAIMNFEITVEEGIMYEELASPDQHECGCAYGQPDGADDFIKECDCSPEFIKDFLKTHKERHA